MAEFTPMMKQYLETKKRCPDCILFFRLGDFYEMFFDDAQVAGRELQLVVTGKGCGQEERAPMCGVPYHAAMTYISKLVSKGYKVAVCEQLEDPALAKGIVKRDIVRIYSPGTVLEDQMLTSSVNNYIVSICSKKGIYGFAAADISTGEMRCTSITIGTTARRLADELAKYTPRELILNADAEDAENIKKLASNLFSPYISEMPEDYFNFDEAKELLLSCGADKKNLNVFEPGVNAGGALVKYFREMQKGDIGKALKVEFYRVDEFMALDASSRRNLEITETMKDKTKKGSLLWVMDKTVTAMGGRMLRKWIEQPLIDKEAIDERLDSVEELKDEFMMRSETRELLNGVYDIERLANKVLIGNLNARDLVSLRQSLGQLPYIKSALSAAKTKKLKKDLDKLDTLKDIADLLERAIDDDPPITVTDGGIIKKGYDEEIDRCREAATGGKKWLTDLETKEREETGIKTLKVGYNKVFGYYIEVSKSFVDLVPDRYIRKQTLVNGERYISAELKEMEDTILGAEERLTKLEYEKFDEIRKTVASRSDALKETALAIAEIDTMAALAELADRENYCKPVITEESRTTIKDGRHPVIEKVIGRSEFVPNDVLCDTGENMMLVITGPNMAGKSTYMRTVALITLMAQAGSFVPASEAEIGIADRLFTRVGASDDLASGQSTFMVEMSEVATILAGATPRSLLILDEIGRGTSTFDGLSIAWSVLEYIAKEIKARTLFATHYHELTELEGTVPGVKNYCVEIRKNGDDITFIRKVKRGGADRSYGIAVAALAGIPKAVTIRAKEILEVLEEQDISRKEVKSVKKKARKADDGRLDLFAFATDTAARDEVIEALKAADVQNMTPLEAMNMLYDLKQKAMKRT
ncbi:MAG: DNA mismatch repair protein MutS [Clostridia bacterium]|nr:DNA mismatch repair protein MutS [Clostridia bacterium]